MMEVPNSNNSNKNRNETRRDHDITTAGAFNIKLPAKLATWSDTGDGVLYYNQKIIFELDRTENPARKEAPPTRTEERRIAINTAPPPSMPGNIDRN